MKPFLFPVRLAAWLVRGLVQHVARGTGLFCALVFKSAWFRAKYDARVYTPHVAFDCILGPRVVLGVDVVVRAGVRIGDYTYVNRGTTIDCGSVGKYCSIAAYVAIGPIAHPLDRWSSHPAFYDPSWGIVDRKQAQESKPAPVIGNDVWLGRNVVVLRGVTIGDGAVIGANAVVTRDIPAYAIAAGVPAKVIRHRVTPATALAGAGAPWWDDPASLKQILALQGELPGNP